MVAESVTIAKHLGDFTTKPRVLVIAAIAIVVGSCGVIAGVVLLDLIRLVTNLAYFGRFTLADIPFSQSHLGLAAVAVPVIGSLIVGLIARYGSEKIRGHGIPEAIEAILLGRSRLDVKVAILKPLSSAIAIGTGGPFGAEGPIIMTGGAFGSLFSQLFKLSSMERKTLMVAGASAGMAGIFSTPVAATLIAVELLLFEWKPRSFIPVAIAAAAATIVREPLLGPGPLFAYHSSLMPLAGLFICIPVGITAGLLSGLLTWLTYRFEDGFGKLPVHWMWWPAIGGVL
ncbi:MAG: chloride channel protein, partial [Alphaproteobacteria bacterium]|nr:chloride channel protein [Alphaproteobacteria bacterium]